MFLTRRRFLSGAVAGAASLSLPAAAGPSGRLFRFPSVGIPAEPESWIELDLEKMRHNLKRVRERAAVPVMAVIKANAYGHGLVEVGNFLDRMNIAGLMVCRLEEAVQLREQGIRCAVYNFGPVLQGHAEVLVRRRITPMLSGHKHAELDRAARSQGLRFAVHVHIDTGMHRAGIPSETAQIPLAGLAELKGLRITGLSTTLTEDDDFDPLQLDRLLQHSRRLNKWGVDPVVRHAASSAGLLSHPKYRLDLVRPGILLYGYYPNSASRRLDPLGLAPVLSFKCRVAEVKILRPGEGVSYHRTYRADHTHKIAVLPVGYSDGYPPRAAGRGHVLIHGTPCPIVASITANHTEVRLPPGLEAKPGDPAVLIGSQGESSVTADDLADWAGTSNYKILIGLNPLLPRISSGT
jgi:alanine racemase